MHQAGQGIGPKVPHRAQRLGQGAEEQHRAAQGPQHREAPQLSAAPPQKKAEGGAPHGQAVGRVQRAGKAGKPQPKGPQQVVQHPGGQPQQDGLAEHQHLLGDLGPPPYPHRRLKKPPRPCPPSS